MAPSISFRKSIKWSDGEAQEPTSTLVLTTSSGHYIDIRLLLSSPSTLSWAFTGPSLSSPAPPNEALGTHPRQSTWTHWVDTLKPSGFQDSGVMYTRSDGSVLEIGRMENPDTGREEGYEEVWVDEAAMVIPGEEGGQAVCHAIKLDTLVSKGMVIRVGEWIQGLRIDGEGEGRKVTVERWHWSKGSGEEVGKWHCEVRIGEGQLPTWFAMGSTAGEAGEGRQVKEEMEGWKVLEYELFRPE